MRSRKGFKMSKTDWTIDEFIQRLQEIRQEYGNIPVRLCDESEWRCPENWIFSFDADAAMSNDNDCHYEAIIH